MPAGVGRPANIVVAIFNNILHFFDFVINFLFFLFPFFFLFFFFGFFSPTMASEVPVGLASH